jgi:hypothetical protein
MPAHSAERIFWPAATVFHEPGQISPGSSLCAKTSAPVDQNASGASRQTVRAFSHRAIVVNSWPEGKVGECEARLYDCSAARRVRSQIRSGVATSRAFSGLTAAPLSCGPRRSRTTS